MAAMPRISTLRQAAPKSARFGYHELTPGPPGRPGPLGPEGPFGPVGPLGPVAGLSEPSRPPLPPRRPPRPPLSPLRPTFCSVVSSVQPSPVIPLTVFVRPPISPPEELPLPGRVTPRLLSPPRMLCSPILVVLPPPPR